MSKILLIEDDLDIQKIYSETLRLKGFDVIAVTTGTQGLKMARTMKPNLIILDIILPKGISGFDVLNELKRNEGLKNIPVIVLTNLETEKQVAKTLGISEYLIKTQVTPSLVVEKVIKHLKK